MSDNREYQLLIITSVNKLGTRRNYGPMDMAIGRIFSEHDTSGTSGCTRARRVFSRKSGNFLKVTTLSSMDMVKI